MAPQYRNRFLENQRSIPVNPEIATALGGADEALILQQLNYWLASPKVGQFRDGRHWVYNTYEKWQENFPWLSVSTIRRIIGRMEKEGIVLSTDKYNEAKTNRTKWYTIDEERLGAFLSGTPSDDSDSRAVQNEQVDCSDWAGRAVQNGQVDCSKRAGLEMVRMDRSGHKLPETTTKTTIEADPDDSPSVVDESDPFFVAGRLLGLDPGPGFRDRAAQVRSRGPRLALDVLDSLALQAKGGRRMTSEAQFFAVVESEMHTQRTGRRR